MKNTNAKSKLKKFFIIIGIITVMIALSIFILLKLTILKSFPVLKGEPEIGKWYDVEVDSSLLLYDGWHETAVNLWKSPTQTNAVSVLYRQWKNG